MGIEEFLLKQAKEEGIELGNEEGNYCHTKSLLTSTDFTIAGIADLVGVNEDFVLKVKSDFNP